VTSKGPMTNLAGSSAQMGFMGAFLKSCGYDGLVIQGHADRWSYLFINGEKAELRMHPILRGKIHKRPRSLIPQRSGHQGRGEHTMFGPAAEKKSPFWHHHR